MDSFQAKIGQNSLRKRENKNYRSVPFRSNPTGQRTFQKNSKKIQKIKKYHYGVISSQNKLEKAQREKIKIIVSFRSDPTRKRKLKKKQQKYSKKLKDTIMTSFQAKIGR